MAKVLLKKKLIISSSGQSQRKLFLAVFVAMLPILTLWALMTVRQINSVAWLGWRNNPKLKQAQNDLTSSLKTLPQVVPTNSESPRP